MSMKHSSGHVRQTEIISAKPPTSADGPQHEPGPGGILSAKAHVVPEQLHSALIPRNRGVRTGGVGDVAIN